MKNTLLILCALVITSHLAYREIGKNSMSLVIYGFIFILLTTMKNNVLTSSVGLLGSPGQTQETERQWPRAYEGAQYGPEPSFPQPLLLFKAEPKERALAFVRVALNVTSHSTTFRNLYVFEDRPVGYCSCESPFINRCLPKAIVSSPGLDPVDLSTKKHSS